MLVLSKCIDQNDFTPNPCEEARSIASPYCEYCSHKCLGARKKRIASIDHDYVYSLSGSILCGEWVVTLGASGCCHESANLLPGLRVVKLAARVVW